MVEAGVMGNGGVDMSSLHYRQVDAAERSLPLEWWSNPEFRIQGLTFFFIFHLSIPGGGATILEFRIPRVFLS